MTVLPALAVVLAAFFIWLTVRIVNRKERWAKWTAAAVVGVLMLYPLSIGPVQWMTYRKNASLSSVLWWGRVYEPLIRCCEHSPEQVQIVLSKYLEFWMPAEPFEYHGP